jgi:hypothetical protein
MALRMLYLIFLRLLALLLLLSRTDAAKDVDCSRCATRMRCCADSSASGRG